LTASLAILFALVLPAAFPQSLSSPSFDVDPAEGNAWLTSEVVFEVRGHLTEDEVREGLRLSPRVTLGDDDIAVEHVARVPWHSMMPWAKTRVRINPEHAQLFQPETSYALQFGEVDVDLTTITLPRVVKFEAQNPPAPDLGTVPTSSEIVLQFNEPLVWQDGLLEVDPPAEFIAVAEGSADGGTTVRLTPVGRWINGTAYTIRVSAAVEDVHGHHGGQIVAQHFTTEPQPRVVSASPSGESAPVEAPVRIEFDRPVDRASVEASFRVDPPIPGSFTWESESIVAWQPAGLAHSSWYRVSVAGFGPRGDTVVPLEWTFATHDPPINLQLVGKNLGPTMLEAVAQGGLGSYTYQWNTGQTSNKILFKGAPGPQTVEVTVNSGDRTATAAIEVYGQWGESYTPLECPPGWDMVEVSVCYRWEDLPGQSRKFITRVDLKDPGVQVRSALAGDRLGAARTLTDAARSHGAVAAINGDFFYLANGGHYPLGPLIRGGAVVAAPWSRQSVLAFNAARGVWTGSAAELRLSAQSTENNRIDVQGLNDIPGPDAISIFNAQWGEVLSLGALGCVATYVNPDGAMRAPDEFACGPLTNVRIPAGGYVLVARGAAADWLNVHAGHGISTAYTSPLGALDFIVGGSHTLVAGGVPTALPADAWHPRSMIGVDADGFLYLVAVEGFGENIGGMTLRELQAYALALGLTNAINLDGGGSTGMFVKGWVQNNPSDGRERVIASLVEVSREPVAGCRHPFVRC
jgi:hypothetical protein